MCVDVDVDVAFNMIDRYRDFDNDLNHVSKRNASTRNASTIAHPQMVNFALAIDHFLRMPSCIKSRTQNIQLSKLARG